MADVTQDKLPIDNEEERKRDQRRNEKSRRQSQAALDQALKLEKVESDIASINTTMVKMFEFLAGSDVLTDEKGALEEAKRVAITSSEASEAAAGARKDIAKILQENDIDWDEPRFDSARAAMKRGEYDSAKELVKANLEDKAGLEDKVKQILATMNKDTNRVDTGEPTAGSEGGFPRTIAEMKARLRGPGAVEFYRKNRSRILSGKL